VLYAVKAGSAFGREVNGQDLWGVRGGHHEPLIAHLIATLHFIHYSVFDLYLV
jgi:hypothetical protein